MATAKRTRLTRVQQQARTRATLLDAAGRVFIERGLQGASVEAIAAEAGYTRGAFYSNFESKDQLFSELLQDRVFSVYRGMAADSTDPAKRPSARELGVTVAVLQGHPDARWVLRLWLELMAHAGRDARFRKLTAEFWTGTRELGAAALGAAYEAAGEAPPVAPDHLVSALIALDIGLALQHFVDPVAVPDTLYPELFDLLFGPLEPPRG